MNIKLKNKLLLAGLLTLFTAQAVDAQTKIKDGTITSPALPDVNAILELESGNKGLLLPRVQLDSTLLTTPLTAHIAGMAVYNTATVHDVTPGYYYNDGTRWVKIGNDAGGPEPWFVRLSTNEATLNTENIYQQGNVAIGTQNGIGTFQVDAAKNNAATGTPTATQVLDDIIVTPGGRIGFGYNPSDLVIAGKQLDDKVTFQANEDLDVNYSLATTSNAQAIVHRNIISNGTIGARTARPNGTSITAFEGHTSTSSGTYGGGSLITQQRAGIVLRTGKENAYGGEIWFGTSGASQDDGGKSLTTTAGNIYRAVMDQRGRWAFGADPNHDAFYRNPTERLDLILGSIRIGALGYGALAAWKTAEIAERPNYISTDPNDRLVVVDANGVLKNKEVSAILPAAVTADNGLTQAAGNIRLGGNLITATTITTDAANTLAIAGLQAGTSTDKVVVADATGILKTVDQSALNTEPWFVQGTTAKATDNAEHIYQTGSVAIGKDSVVNGAMLDVSGSVRGGNASGGSVGANSLAVGDLVTASGQNATAFGWHHIASGLNSMVWGGQPTHGTDDSLRYNIASGIASTSWGYGNRSANFGTTTWGTQNKATNPQATAFGASNQATGYWSTAFGQRNIASGNNATSFGTDNIATGNSALAFGKTTSATDQGATAFGEYTKAKGRYSTAFGQQSIAASQNETVFGRWNADTTSTNVNSWQPADALLQIGNGADATTRSNAVTVLKNGNTAIGTHTTRPNSTLQVAGSVAANVVAVTADYTVKGDDYTIVCRASSAITLTLPDPTTCKGRMYYIINNGSQPVTTSSIFEVSNGNTQDTVPVAGVGIGMSFPNFGNKYLLQSDGTIWVLISLG